MSTTALSTTYGSNNIVCSCTDEVQGYTGFGKTLPQNCVDINGNLQLNGYIMDTNDLIIRTSNTANKVILQNGFGSPAITVQNNNVLTTAFSQITDGRSNNIYVDCANVNGFCYIGMGGYSSNIERPDFGAFASRFRWYKDMRNTDGSGFDSYNNYAQCNLLYFNGAGQVSIGTKGILPNQTLSVNGSIYASNMNTGSLACNYLTANNNITANNLTANLSVLGANLVIGNNTQNMYFQNPISSPNAITLNSYNAGTSTYGCFTFQFNYQAFRGDNISTWSTVSDTRLKRQVTEITDGLDVISKIVPISYQWKEPKAHGNNSNVLYGYSAQNLKEILPHTVGESIISNEHEKKYLGPDQKSYTVNSDITPWLVLAIKELNIKVDKLISSLKV